MNKKENIIVIAVLIVLAALLVWTNFSERDKYPKLHRFGINEWSVHCKGQSRLYRLVSKNLILQSTRQPRVTRRSLIFLDENGEALYQTSVFDIDSLDKEGVWRFTYRKFDPRLFVKKEPLKVLQGDEKIFEIAENFQSMVVTLQKGQKLKLPCQRVQ